MPTHKIEEPLGRAPNRHRNGRIVTNIYSNAQNPDLKGDAAWFLGTEYFPKKRRNLTNTGPVTTRVAGTRELASGSSIFRNSAG